MTAVFSTFAAGVRLQDRFITDQSPSLPFVSDGVRKVSGLETSELQSLLFADDVVLYLDDHEWENGV